MLIFLGHRRVRRQEPGKLGERGATAVPRVGKRERSDVLAGDRSGASGPRGELYFFILPVVLDF